MTWMVQAVLRKSGSSPRSFWMMLGPMPMSENMVRPTRQTLTMAMSPKASGKRRRQRIRLLSSRSAWLAP